MHKTFNDFPEQERRIENDFLRKDSDFDGKIVIGNLSPNLISAIDEVYPELRLAERIANTRQVLRGVRPEVMEPAHVRTTQMAELALREIGNIFKRVGPGIPEPAHYLRAERDILAEIEAVVRKYGA